MPEDPYAGQEFLDGKKRWKRVKWLLLIAGIIIFIVGFVTGLLI